MTADVSDVIPTTTEHLGDACPIGDVVDMVFSRWTTPVLWALHVHGRQRFLELQRRIGTISPKVLTQRLRQMERDGLVIRTYHAEVPPRVEYEISELGLRLAPIFAELNAWSDANMDDVQAARQRYDASPSAPRP
jgi:DNA-binding HxlR family transcriptional regulator